MIIIIRFIHTGDVHLGLQFKNLSFDKDKSSLRRTELWNTFQRILAYGKQKSIDFLLIAGDLFEGEYFTLGDIKRLRDIFSKYADINILISAGNHDYVDYNSLYNKIEWSGNVTIFNSRGLEKKYFPELNTAVYGYSWDSIQMGNNNLFNGDLNIDRRINNILLIHGDVAKESKYLPLTINKLKSLNMDYIALGHIHKPDIISSNIAYCGSPEPLDFGETGIHGFIEGHIDNEIRIELVDFSKRRFILKEIVIDENHIYDDILNKIMTLDEGNSNMDYYRVHLKGYIQRDINKNLLMKEIENEFYHMEIIDETLPDYDLEMLEEYNKDNIIGLYIKSMREKDLSNPIVKDALYIGLNGLLKGR